MTSKLLLKGFRYVKCYGELAFLRRPAAIEGLVDYCADRPILIAQARIEVALITPPPWLERRTKTEPFAARQRNRLGSRRILVPKA